MLYFGVAGWSYPDWKGVVYPEGRRSKFDELAYLASFVDVIELNNTFYRIPSAKVAESWARRTDINKDFRFTAKLWQGFTHGKEEYHPDDLKLYKEGIQPIVEAEKLGALLLQYPIAFKNNEENKDKLNKLLEEFKDYPLVVEFRHRSWVNEETLKHLESRNVGFCNVDEPVFREMVKPSSVVTGSTGYVRFHGRNYKTWFMKGGSRDTRYDYLYSEEELESWVPRIQEMKKKGRDSYIVANNHFRGQAPANILQLKSKVLKQPVEVPESLIKAFKQLEKVAKKKPGQQKLFDS